MFKYIYEKSWCLMPPCLPYPLPLNFFQILQPTPFSDYTASPKVEKESFKRIGIFLLKLSVQRNSKSEVASKNTIPLKWWTFPYILTYCLNQSSITIRLKFTVSLRTNKSVFHWQTWSFNIDRCKTPLVVTHLLLQVITQLLWASMGKLCSSSM